MSVERLLSDSYRWLDATGRRLRDSSRADLLETAGMAGAGILSQASVLEWLGNIGSKAPTIYDRAMDAQYLKDQVGGGLHRMFDGGHDLTGAWAKVTGASESDSITAEMAGYVDAMLKDASTPAGLPLATWDPSSYQAASGWFADVVPGASKSWFADLVSYDVGEVLACGVVVVCTLLGLKEGDERAVSSSLGSSAAIGVASANPLMLVATIVMVAIAHKRGKRADATAVAEGATLGAIGMAVFAVLSLPVLVELVAVVVVLVMAKKGVDWTRQRLDAAGKNLCKELMLPVPSER